MRRFQTILALSVLMASLPIFGNAQRHGHKDKGYLSSLSRAKASVNKRFTPDQITKIAGELKDADARAAEASQKQAPITAKVGTPPYVKQTNHQVSLAGRLGRQYRNQVRTRYHLTPEEVIAINQEAITTAVKTKQ